MRFSYQLMVPCCLAAIVVAAVLVNFYLALEEGRREVAAVRLEADEARASARNAETALNVCGDAVMQVEAVLKESRASDWDTVERLGRCEQNLLTCRDEAGAFERHLAVHHADLDVARKRIARIERERDAALCALNHLAGGSIPCDPVRLEGLRP